MKNLKDYILQESKTIQGLKGYTYDEVCDIVRDYCDEVISNCDADAEIIDVQLHGSRLRNQAHKKSDLDAVVEYEGSEREDSMFNMLNDDEDNEPLEIEGIKVDINPIRKQESGDMKSYMKKSDAYDKEKLNEDLHNVIHKVGNKWHIRGHHKDWNAEYDTKEDAEAALRAYHANK